MKFCVLIAIVSLITGCYQIHSDDDLRSVPTTNNRTILPNAGGNSHVPGAGF